MPIRFRRLTVAISVLALLDLNACGRGPSAPPVELRGGLLPPGGSPLADEVADLRAQPLVLDPSTPVGTLPGQSGVTPTGQATYSIPLDVAPGVGSMTPELSLEYRSTTQNGLLGVGFSLGGIAPPIRRCDRTLALDGTHAPFEFERTDPLCWGGERLVLVAGTYGTDGAEYRTRRDPFAKIVQHSDLQARDGYFEVFAKDGRILTLGRPEAMLFHRVDDHDIPWTWALRRAEDRFGNAIDYRYHAPTPVGSTDAYALVLDEIAYGGIGVEASRRHVRLEYGPSPHPSWGYVAGVLQGRTQRLDRIVVEGPYAEELARYELAYELDPVSDHSRITEVSKCDAAGTCLPPTTFEWSDPGGPPGPISMGFVAYGLFLGPDADLVDDPIPFASSPSRLVGDFDGDSDHDLLYFTESGWRAWDGSSQFDLLDTQVTVSWPTALPEGDSYVEELIELGEGVSIDDEELTPEELEQAIRDAAAQLHLDRLQPAFTYSVVEANGDLRDDLLIPRRDLGGGAQVDAWGYRFVDQVSVAIAGTPEGEPASAGFTEPVSFVEEVSGFGSAPIYTVVPLDHDGDGLGDLWMCQGEGYKSGRWILALRGPDPAMPSGHYGYTAYDSGVGCSVHDELLVTSLRGGRQDLLVVPAYATGADMPVPADFASPQAYHDDYDPLPEDQRFEYRALSFEPGQGPGELVATGLPRDNYQRWHDRLCRNGLARTFFGRPVASAGLGLDKLADVNGDGLVDILRFELASGDHPGNPELALGLDGVEHWGSGLLCSSDVEANIHAVIRPYINTGTGFEPGPSIHDFQGNPHANLWLNFHRAQLYDFDLDGIVDLLLPSSGVGGDWTAVISNGDGTYTSHAVAGIPPGWPAYAQDAGWRQQMEAAAHVQVMTLAPTVAERPQITFLGYVEDNLDDWPFLINTFATGYGEPHNRIITITNGLGAVEELEYQRISTAGSHGRLGMHTHPLTGLKGATTVVRRHAVQSNPQGDFEVDRYAYHDAVVDASGHGLLGFAEVERWREHDVDHHTWIRYEYDRDEQLADYPGAGRPVEMLEQRKTPTEWRTEYWLTRTQQELETVVESHPGGSTFFTYPSQQVVEVFVRDEPCEDGECEPSPSEQFQWLTVEQERDELGTVVSSTTTNAEETKTYTVHDMLDDQGAWLVGRARSWSEQSCVDGKCDVRAYEATFDPVTGAVVASTFAPNDPVARLDTSYAHDAHGNVTTTTRTNLQGGARSETIEWDLEGVHPESMTNAAGHVSWVIHDPASGVPVAEIAADGVTMVHRYDGFLRPTRHERRVSPMGLPDGHVTAIDYEVGGPLYDDTFTVESALRVRTTAPDGQQLTVDHGSTGHVMQESWWGMESLDDVPYTVVGPGGEVYVSTLYDWHGRVQSRSLPTWAPEQPAGRTTTEYDGLGRVVTVAHPDGGQDRYRHAALSQGLSTEHIDDTEAVTRVQLDAASRPVHTIDARGTRTCFEYGPFGVLQGIRRDCMDPASPWVSTYTHDVAGRILTEADPSFGTRARVYNGFGELVQQTDGAGEIVAFDYDALGRLLVRHDADGDTTHTYDAPTPGRLHTIESPDGLLSTYNYDASGRLDSIAVADLTFAIPGALVLQYHYGVGDRLDWLEYPSVDGDPGLSAHYAYDDAGYLRRVELGNGQLLWSALEGDEAGRLVRERFGNGLDTARSYDPLTGLPLTVQTSGPGGVVQSLGYDWHPWGELEQRFDVLNAQQETFEYDDLRRLTSATVVQGPDLSTVGVGYDDVGNITHKTDIGDYAYQDGRLLAYGGMVPVVLGHDARGNVIDHGGRTLTYTSFDKVRQIVDGAETLEFRYDGQGQRFSRYSALDDDLTVAVGGLYERRVVQGKLQLTYRVRAAGRIVAQVVRTQGAGAWNDTTEHLHDDHLGSTHVVTDETGAVLRRAAFDPWGQARDAEDWSEPLAEGVLDQLGVGFTGHPARLDAGLVDMGGRMYHPGLGRFFSPDPLVISPLDGQAYNRYSYVLNRPLVATDPTGYAPEFGNDDGSSSGGASRECDGEHDCTRVVVVPAEGVPGSSALDTWNRAVATFGYNGIGQGGPHHNPHTAGYTRHGDDSGQPGGTPVFTIRVTPDMCAEIAACSGRLIQHRPVYIWDAPIDDWAEVAADVATDFIPGVALGKTLHEAYDRIQNGEDPVGVLMSASFDGVLGLIPGGKTGRKLQKALDKADDVADAAGDLQRAARAGHNGVHGPPLVKKRRTRGGETAANVRYPDGTTMDVSPRRVKESVPNTHPKAPPGNMQKVKFENAQPGTKGYKRNPDASDLEWLE